MQTLRVISRITLLALRSSPFTSIAMFLSLLLWAISPIIELAALKSLVDALLQHASRNVAPFLITYILWGLFIPNCCWRAFYFFYACVRQYAQRNLAQKNLQKAEKLPLRLLEDPATQNLIDRTSKVDTGDILGVLLASTFLLSGALRTLSILGVLASFNPMIFLIVAVVAIPSFIARNMMSIKARQLVRKQTERERWCSAMLDLLLERKAAPELASSYNRTLLSGRWLNVRRQLDAETARMEKRRARLINLSVLIRSVGQFSVFFIVLVLLAQGAIQVGALASCIIALGYLQWVISAGLYQISDLLASTLVLEDLDKLWSLENEDASTQAGAEEKASAGDANGTMASPRIELRDVVYQYPRATSQALSGISFTIEPGDKVVLIGKNGSGKTTVLRLLAGLDTPTAGSILIDGKPLDRRLSRIRTQSTVMFQESVRYELSARLNVVISDIDVQHDSEHMRRAIAQADLAGTIDALPDGIETMLGPDLTGGTDLSDGQWQRLALARAYFRERPLVLLDEPTMAMDAFHETQLYMQFMKMAKEHTTIIVSHRLPIARLADKIIVLDEGRVVEQGSHAQLITHTNGIYHRMFQAQSEMYCE
ncbi:MAG TPA: ABC transporter ATP-binding protein [Ktedonosporobacter sp.]|jgi:ATP-binding cassette subfamily B protein|nr:ABC transporter ATP-binding protein [Ktedonosporobacter sp.]